jgi:hypothetical protein
LYENGKVKSAVKVSQDYADDEGDLEAVAGLKAMKIAEEQDLRGYKSTSFSQLSAHLHVGDSDSGDNKVNLGLFDGDFEEQMSYVNLVLCCRFSRGSNMEGLDIGDFACKLGVVTTN